MGGGGGPSDNTSILRFPCRTLNFKVYTSSRRLPYLSITGSGRKKKNVSKKRKAMVSYHRNDLAVGVILFSRGNSLSPSPYVFWRWHMDVHSEDANVLELGAHVVGTVNFHQPLAVQMRYLSVFRGVSVRAKKQAVVVEKLTFPVLQQ